MDEAIQAAEMLDRIRADVDDAEVRVLLEPGKGGEQVV
jgi:hypothetical protein